MKHKDAATDRVKVPVELFSVCERGCLTHRLVLDDLQCGRVGPQSQAITNEGVVAPSGEHVALHLKNEQRARQPRLSASERGRGRKVRGEGEAADRTSQPDAAKVS